MDIMSMLIPILTGGGGGLLAGKAMPKFSLGTIGNIICGLLGGGIGSQLIGSVLGVAAGGETGMDIGGLLGNVAAGGVGGGGLMAVIGMIKNMLAK